MQKITNKFPTGSLPALFLVIFTLLLNLTSCGFHLRGSGDYGKFIEAMNPIFIASDQRNAKLKLDLQRHLRIMGGRMVNNVNQAETVIRILSADFQRHVLAVNKHAKANEYQLTYHIKVEVLDAKGQTIISAQEFTFRRDYQEDSKQKLGSLNREREIKKEMLKGFSRRLISLVHTHLRKQRAATPETKNSN